MNMKPLFLAPFLFCASLLLSPAAAFEYQLGDIHIFGGEVIDGTGSPAAPMDVVIRDGKIAAMIPNPEPGVDARVTAIDATGKVLTPGFIDTHSHGNPEKTPGMESFLAQGVTTIILGQDGSSTRAGALAEWFDEVAAAQPGPNVATLIGHGTVRNEAGVGLSTSPTTQQICAMAALVETAMKAGALGLSTGLEYQPGTFAAKDELAAVAKPVGARGGVVMSHLRSEDDDVLADAIRELIEQCRAAGARAHVSHIKSVYGKGAARAEEILGVLQTGRDSGVEVTADIYPYNASYTGLSILFPDFALPPNDYKTVAQQDRQKLLEYLDQRVNLRNGPEATLFGTGEDAGKTLAEVADKAQKPYAEVLAEKGPEGGSAAYFVMDEELQSRLLAGDGVNVCSDGSPTMRHPRGHGSFARIIRKYVQEDGVLTLEEAIHKMSGLPAKTSGLAAQGRGTLKVGNAADVLIFNPAQVRDNATFSDPYQLSSGFDTILVNGAIVRENGTFADERRGQVLRRKDS